MNLNYGNISKEFIPHKKEIISLHYSDKNNLLISLGNDNIIKIHTENDIKSKEIKKEIVLDNLDISLLNYNLEYNLLFIGTTQGELKYFNISHLKLEVFNIDSEYKKRFKNDPIINILILDEYPICLICHESSRNIFEIIPPHPLKHTFFGEFTNFHIFEELNNEKKNSRIISLSADKINGILYFGDMQGYINCYSIKKLLELFNNGIINDEIDKNNNINTFKEKVNILKKYQIEYIFCFKGHSEPIKYLKYFDIDPSILVTIANDRKVKIFSPKGEYIDEFRQSMEKYKEVPIGIKYYFTDPFVSKVNSDEIKESHIVFRKDIENFRHKRNRLSLDKMRKVNLPIAEYNNKIIEYNAQERLFLLTKNCGLNIDRSSPWNYIPDLELILSEEKIELENKMVEIKKLETKYNINNSYEAIYNESYRPKFFTDIDEIKVKDFGDNLNHKIKIIKLALSKYEKNSDNYKTYEKELKRIDNISYKNEVKFIYGDKSPKKIKTKKIVEYEKERNFILGTKKNRFKNIKKQFNYYKEDFNRNILELKTKLENKLNLSDNKININKNKHDINKKMIKYLKLNTNIKKKLLPSLSNKVKNKNISPPPIIYKSESNVNFSN